ncbi:TlpA family protein disulfide reductase [Flavobacterium jejuense]|uniref:TlpA family protein disulfide reductase n=1 Tax=Flavobacterium jejuense TaxID=1544455 RepID=A0ABX0IL84_9FLAO|nr:TlpA disulfide reductase family protein [Flavobacterium jejuense]NHN24348.1 TlpA family protein disulfide reductase [Flavobacterium jejuense]
MKKLIFIVCLLVATVIYSQKNVQPIKVYELEGITVSSYDFEGLETFFKQKDDTIYIINFWATWCAPCIKELPYFEGIGKKYKEKNVKIILVSLDFPKKVETSLLPFIKRKKLVSDVIHLNDPDANSWIEKVNKGWSGAIPATIIYKNDDAAFYEQSFTYEELEKELLKMLNK